MKHAFFLLCCQFCALLLLSQEKKNTKFGKITPEDFIISSPVIDSNTNAVILSDIGSSEFEGNQDGWFRIVFRRHKRVKVLNKNGFNVADIVIYLHSDAKTTDKLENLKAATYNLENGAVVATKLDSKDVYRQKLSKELIESKFTFPAVKEGSIIEYDYVLRSDFMFNLQPWDFQGPFPCLWSEYEVAIPDFFDYVFLSQGYLPYYANKKDYKSASYLLTTHSSPMAPARTFTVSSNETHARWIVKDAPALKEENFTSSLRNHNSRIEFQLSQIRLPNQPVEYIMENWEKVSKRMIESESFGAAFTNRNGWLDDELKNITKGISSTEEKARKIYEYVRDHFTCTTSYGVYLSDATSVKEIFRKKSGSVSDINLLLLAMLRHESIPSEPVILSLRNRGAVHMIYPLMDKFNYMIVAVNIDDKSYYLDASQPMMGFGKLPSNCYNGIARVISGQPGKVELSPDSLLENKVTSVSITNGAKGSLEGVVISTLGNHESYQLRERMHKENREDLLKELSKEYSTDVKLDSLLMDSLNIYEEPVTVSYAFKSDAKDEDIIYFNPMMAEGMKENPFKSANRLYPVEMPFRRDETYLLDMEIPKGYKVEELPQSARVKLNDNEGMFEYIFSKNAEKVMMRCRLVLYKATYQQEDYDPLRQFFGMVVKKEKEQIVFKKIK